MENNVSQNDDRGRKLYDIVTKWRDDNNVWDGEVIALYDNVRETFDDLIHELIRTVGYAPYKEPHYELIQPGYVAEIKPLEEEQ